MLGKPLEQDPPGREEILLIAGGALLESQQVGEAWLDPAALLRIGDVLLDRRAQLRTRRVGLLVLDDVAAHPDHLRQRPVSDPFAVGEAAAAMPEDVVLRDPSMYFSNSHDRRDFPMPAMPVTETSCAFCSSAEPWNSSLTSRSSRSRPTNGASRPDERSAPFDPATTRSARQSGTGSALPFSSWLPASS